MLVDSSIFQSDFIGFQSYFSKYYLYFRGWLLDYIRFQSNFVLGILIGFYWISANFNGISLNFSKILGEIQLDFNWTSLTFRQILIEFQSDCRVHKSNFSGWWLDFNRISLSFNRILVDYSRTILNSSQISLDFSRISVKIQDFY